MTTGVACLMIKHVRPGVMEPGGWASDLLDVMQTPNISQTLRTKMARCPIVGALILEFLDAHPTGETSYWQRIRRAKTDLDLTYFATVDKASKPARFAELPGICSVQSEIPQQDDNGKLCHVGRQALSEMFKREMIRP